MSPEVKHTPGPWVAKRAEKRRESYRPIFEDGLWEVLPAGATATQVPICVLDHADDHHAPCRLKAEIDARLIAAAPDLLEALKWAIGTVNCEPFEWTCQEDADSHYAALAAIGKAEGHPTGQAGAVIRHAEDTE